MLNENRIREGLPIAAMSDRAQTDDGDTTPRVNGAHGPRHARSDDDSAPAKRKRSIVVLSVVLAVLIVGVGLGIGYLAWQQYQLDRVVREARETPIPVVNGRAEPALMTELLSETKIPVENPIDFPALKSENPDIYAWIYIPGTEVNHPILQHPDDNDYYLAHNRDKQIALEGALYSQSVNRTDFRDPVTLIYGHNMINNGMFATLHYFEDSDFFADNDTFYLYTPKHILTYRIVSAYMYDDRHIMNSFDFSDSQTLKDYLAFIQNPDVPIANTRDDVELSIDKKIVQLSTCMSDIAYSSDRYLVSGVLVDDQPAY
jgi:sortase B